MAVSSTIVGRERIGQQLVNTVDIVPDNSWLSTGEPFAANLAGLTQVKTVTFDPVGGYVFRYDRANSAILAYQQTDPQAAGGANIPLVAVNANDLSALTVRATFWGK